jgi:hypothetical protein
LHRTGLHNRAPVIEPALEQIGHATALGLRQLQLRHDQRQVPTQLNCPRLQQQAEQLFLPWLSHPPMLAHHGFQCVRRSGSHGFVLVPQALDQLAAKTRLFQHDHRCIKGPPRALRAAALNQDCAYRVLPCHGFLLRILRRFGPECQR